MVKKILIIDDEKGICDVVKEYLEKTGDFKVGIAANGEDGINAANSLKPHLILLDIRMPGKYDGIQVLKRLKKSEATVEIPVVMMTALPDDSFKDECLAEYDEEYIVKPVELAVLKAKIEEVLKRRNVA